MIQPSRFSCLLCACVLVDAPAPAEAFELSGGVSVGGILIGTEPKLAVSPFAGVLWRTPSGFLLEAHNMFSIVPGPRVGVYDRTAASFGYAWGTGNFSIGAVAVDLFDARVRHPEQRRVLRPSHRSRAGWSRPDQLVLCGTFGSGHECQCGLGRRKQSRSSWESGGDGHCRTCLEASGGVEMNKRFAVLLLGLPACNYDAGECYVLREEGEGVVGGVIISSGAGGFGDVPPEPQNAADQFDPCSTQTVECTVTWKADSDVCKDKSPAGNCTTLYQGQHASLEEAKERCEKDSGVGNGSGALSCGPCHWASSANNDCYDKCDAIADKEREKCQNMAPGPDRAKCNQAVEEQRTACYSDCNKKK